jgi:hypothetical protein
MPESQGHTYGKLESVKFDCRRKDFYRYIGYLKQQNVHIEDLLYNFSSYIGHMTLNRLLTLYDLYKEVQSIAGHVADVGVYKGASSLLFAKLIKIFESESLTLCHGFDWFQGMVSGKNDSKLSTDGGYKSNYEDILTLVKMQKLDNILKIHNLDLRVDITQFFKKNKHLRFKLILMDCGRYDVVKACLPFFWERLNKKGIIIFDQYSNELAPGETLALHECLPNVIVRTVSNSWTPSCYIIKE